MINIREFVRVFGLFFVFYFLSFFIIYKSGLNKQVIQSEDFIATATLPFSLIKEQNYDLDEYYDLLTEFHPNPDGPLLTPYYLKETNGHFYSFFPTFTAVLAIPLYIIPSYMKYDYSIEAIGILSRMGGAFITALSVAVFWFIIKAKVTDKKARVLLLLAYALGTNSFSTSSQGLWQHGTSQLFNGLGLLSLIYNLTPFAGLSFGLASVARPTNLLSLAVFGVYVIIKNLKTKNHNAILAYIGFALIPIMIQLYIDTKIFGSITNTGYGSHNGYWTANIIEGFLGMWLSPSKGLLITSPILLLMFYGIYQSIKNFKTNQLNVFVIIVIFLYTLIMGKWYNWFGGYSWGTRMSSDVIPYLIFILIPLINSAHFKKKLVQAIFTALLTISIVYHFAGLIFFDGVWHTIYDGKNRYWLCDIQNSEPVFSVKRGLYKVGIGTNPVPENLIQQAEPTDQIYQ